MKVNCNNCQQEINLSAFPNHKQEQTCPKCGVKVATAIHINPKLSMNTTWKIEPTATLIEN